MNRREWIQTVGVALPGVACLNLRTPLDRIEKVGVQLYTVRDAMAKDFEGTITKVAEIGYQEVEFAGYYNRDPKAVRALLDKVGLTAPSTHVGFDMMGDAWPKLLDDAKVIGHQYIVVPSIPDDLRKTQDGYRQAADRFNKAGEAALKAGIQFGYHNHNAEFQMVDGRMPYDTLLEACDPKLVQFEMDLYWIIFGGADPLKYFARWPGRFPLVHVKDMTAQHTMTDVGSGVINWKQLFAHHEAGIKHYIVEHDQPASPFDSIRASYGYLSKLEF